MREWLESMLEFVGDVARARMDCGPVNLVASVDLDTKSYSLRGTLFERAR